MEENNTTTPDSEQELRKLAYEFVSSADPDDRNWDWLTDELVALIKADRLRTAKEARIDELRQMERSANLYSDSSSMSLIIRVWLPERIKQLQENTDET